MLLETDFLSTWNSIALFGDFLLLVQTIGEILFLKITLFLLVETDFLPSGNYFFLPFSDNPVTNSFIFSSNGNLF